MAGDISAGIRSYLAGLAAVTDVTSTRIYAGHLPQKATLPAIVYYVISGTHDHHLTGSANFGMTRIQMDCYATTRGTANSLGEILRKNLTHYRGAAGSETVDNINAGSPRERDESPKDSSDSWRYVHSRDYLVWHSEPAVST